MLKGCYLAAKAVYEAGDDLDETLLILENGSSVIDRALRDVEKGRSIPGKSGGNSAAGNDGDSPLENTRRVKSFQVGSKCLQSLIGKFVKIGKLFCESSSVKFMPRQVDISI